ncbi:MAG: molybdopterin-guanine dinucleotide biosynthesis protein A [Alphaproteobacteria bacterium]|jgi:hypothetical protein|nr:molybdopterin-guanine dinucleotide biosynthesis protein A [Alphaproteobacteria bacterium]MDP6829950.1 molybdopterin-guanine dinucleotide biosynthesis protein A [Alphaproteobacteria bacterium]MDP6871918.1 molybdopterin-guanine dinucleotide biosynthesis protein A [Alphaproteobacteria bacterium]
MPRRKLPAALLIGLLLCPLLTATPVAWAAENHAGYYYPAITSQEVYQARSPAMSSANRETRIGFVVAQTSGQRQLQYPPRFAMFAKGDEAEKLIIIGLDEHSFATLFRARAVMAQLTASARGSALFRNMAVEDLFTFFDLAKMLGFRQITVSDGRNYAHRIDLQ